ncbi:LysR family transcriptional regulator [Sphingosinicella sp. LHD-64]|uniref:LysR family transcriptional regulator n=1 Tax=Sphingosinicella sp. LHD-64 TaxID=3072139 RepID=UPI00280CFA40|nr:LysR family transcriptional regulator [Sphingosinicella sp. LHD-64]MDQ8755681.1 LysR family transcriptional regulator [Sphingosinicella sp. LHD-64]
MAAASLDWDDLKYFLAVARTGSTLGAGRALRVSQTTVARRIAAFEEKLGLILFERRQAGYAPTPAGEALVARAEAMEAAAAAFAEAAGAQSRDASGSVCVTMLELYAVTIAPPILRDLHAAHPGLRVQLDTADLPRDLGAGEADVALRGVYGMPEDRSLVGRRIAPDPWTLYCSRDYAAAHARPRSAADLRQHPIIGGGGEKIWPMYRAWLRRHRLEEAVTIQHSSGTGLLAAVRAGAGLAVLPSFLADRDPELVRCLEPIAGDPAELWLLTTERLRHTPRVRVVMDFLADRLTRLARVARTEQDEGWAA